MSSLHKLKIQGIRSFGQGHEDVQIIRFFNPLTLIVGKNGAGKTTIIECLRYVTTGDMPPGVKGNAFVHDPKVAKEKEVKAQVMLKFRDIADQDMVVTRNLIATQKESRVEFKTIEGVVHRTNKHGEEISTSSKCLEMNREMETSLGVSKPVLNNVIFCHQEESNWPLGEGKFLKNKFDEIFAATRYIKAMECIRKVRLNQSTQLKEYDIELKYLKENKDRSVSLEKEFENTSTKMEVSKDKIREIYEQLDPIEERRKMIISKQGDIATLEGKIAKIRSDKEHILRSQKELEENLEEIFKGSTEQLKEMIREHETIVVEKAASLKQNEKKMNYLSSELQSLVDDKSRQMVAQGKLEHEAENHKRRVEHRNREIQKAATDYDIAGFSQSDYEIDDVNKFQKRIEKLRSNMKEERQSKKEEFEEEEVVLQMEVDDLKTTKTTLINTDDMKTRMIKENEAELQNIKRKLRNMDASAHQLKELESDLKQAEEELKTAKQGMNLDKLRVEINDLQKEKQEKDRKMSDLNKEMTTLTQQSQIRTQHNMLQKNKNEKESEIRKIRNRHEEEIQQLLGSFPTTNVKAQLQEFCMKKTNELRQSQKRLQSSKSEMSAKETRRTMIMDQLKKKEEELHNDEERLFQECGSQDVENSLDELQTTINNLQSEKGALSGSKHLFERYIKSLKRTEAQCPLCHRGFDGDEEVDELVQELEGKLRMAPQKMIEKENLIEQSMTKRNKLIHLKPIKENMKKITSEIPNLKRKVTSVGEEISKLRSVISQEEDRMNSLQLDESMANEIRPDMIKMEECQKELAALDRKLVSLSAQFAGADTSRTLQLVDSERSELEIKLESVNKRIESKRRQIEEQNDRLQILNVNVNSITSEKLRLTGELQQRQQLQSQQTELASSNQLYAREIQDAREQLKPIKNKLSELVERKRKLIENKEKILENIRKELDQISEKQKDITILNKEVKRYYEERKDEKINQGLEGIREVEKKISHLGKKVEELQRKIDQLKEDVAKQQVNERTMLDNLQLRQKQADLEVVQVKLTEMNKQLGGFDHIKLEDERVRLNREYENLMKEKHQAEARMAVFKEQIKKLRAELQSESVKNSKEKHTDMLIKLKTTDLAKGDLDKYYSALNRAIMKYHNMKMAEINRIIKELWVKTYKGEDIDYIEIQADEDDASTAGTARRTFKYRVVLFKKDIQLDMRGRCSAGQKVLASLVIRLALAETFCLNCGILALDEPTTNLDRANIESLASALVSIIESKQDQKNFQLIVITHDEEFVELLGRSKYVDYYYRVKKDERQKSIVSSQYVGNLNATLD